MSTIFSEIQKEVMEKTQNVLCKKKEEVDCTFSSSSTTAYQVFQDQYKHTLASTIAVYFIIKNSGSLTPSSHPHSLMHTLMCSHRHYIPSPFPTSHYPLSNPPQIGTDLHDLPSSSRLNACSFPLKVSFANSRKNEGASDNCHTRLPQSCPQRHVVREREKALIPRQHAFSLSAVSLVTGSHFAERAMSYVSIPYFQLELESSRQMLTPPHAHQLSLADTHTLSCVQAFTCTLN